MFDLFHLVCRALHGKFSPLTFYFSSREQSHLALDSWFSSWDGLFWAWSLRLMGSLYYSGWVDFERNFVVFTYVYMLKTNNGLYCAVVSGLHWLFSYRRFLFLVGFFSSHLFDRYVFVMNVFTCILSLHRSILYIYHSGWYHINNCCSWKSSRNL